MPYLTSTKSQNTEFPRYVKSTGGEWIVKGSVVVRGTANVIGNKTLITPRGAITSITDEELDFLKKNASFMRQVNAGFIAIHYDKKLHTEDLEEKDKSAQYTEKDFRNIGVKVPTTAKQTDDGELTEEEQEEIEAELAEAVDVKPRRGKKARK